MVAASSHFSTLLTFLLNSFVSTLSSSINELMKCFLTSLLLNLFLFVELLAFPFLSMRRNSHLILNLKHPLQVKSTILDLTLRLNKTYSTLFRSPLFLLKLYLDQPQYEFLKAFVVLIHQIYTKTTIYTKIRRIKI